MNKYFLPVYNSELKPWIKWWILKRLNGGESTLKAITISSGTLTKVDKTKPLSVKEYYGNTVQNGTPTPEAPVEIKTISGNITFNINSVNYNLDLKSRNYDYELCKIGNYQDSIFKAEVGNAKYDSLDSTTKASLTLGNWYIEKNIGKVVLNGTENWIRHTVIVSWFYYDGITNGYFNNAINNFALTNYFTQKQYSNVANLTNGEFAYGSNDNGATHRIVFKDTDFTATADFKNWLTTHNVTLYYVLANPTYEIITNENLIEQLNALYEISVDSNTVTISNNSEITLEVLLEYYGR